MLPGTLGPNQNKFKVLMLQWYSVAKVQKNMV